jgi:hypothetical protein
MIYRFIFSGAYSRFPHSLFCMVLVAAAYIFWVFVWGASAPPTKTIQNELRQLLQSWLKFR